MRPLGWELSLFLLMLGVTGVAVVTRSDVLMYVVVYACAIAGPVIVVSFFVRLVAGIHDEGRRRRLRRRAATMEG